jgi:hypothetical protein
MYGKLKKLASLLAALFILQTAGNAVAVSNTLATAPLTGAPKKTAITVAVIDTGIDLDHLAFKGSLVKGMNLLDYNAKPVDDNGHGTNVAGVVLNTYESFKQLVSTPLPLKIMPVKAISSEGDGTEEKLSEGIRYAVLQKADVIVLSLGLDDNEPDLEKAVLEAEKAGISVIAASGNDGSGVKYPAAYRTVLAVGGASDNESVVDQSNRGNEIDLVAPWRVYTTDLGGKYIFNEGTSMAAPQVAAAAALYLNINPSVSPPSLRQLFRQTAKDIEFPGWDPISGYGLLRIPRILSQSPKTDMFEPNNTRAEAKPMPLGKTLSAQMNGSSDRDWFTFNAPYTGFVSFQIEDNPSLASSLQMNVYPAVNKPGKAYTVTANQSVVVPVTEGPFMIELSGFGKDVKPAPYAISARFSIYKDDFEDNNRPYKAFLLPLRTQKITGTFDRMNDEDWFMLQTTRPAKINIRLSAKKSRFDLVLRIQKRNNQLMTVDKGGYYEDESINGYALDSGKYYICISNADNSIVNGEYEMQLELVSQSPGPNDIPAQATKLKTSVPYFSQLSALNATDYYQFSLSRDTLFKLSFDDIVIDKNLKVLLLDSRFNYIPWSQSGKAGKDYIFRRALGKGEYYIRLVLLNNTSTFKYSMLATTDALNNGYLDITGHWAEAAIISLARQKIMQGDGEFRFSPEQSITRAEAVSIVARAFQLNRTEKLSFRDVKTTHWAYDEIAKVLSEKIITGYPDNTFKPDRPVSRAEMGVILAKAMKLSPTKPLVKPFSDVSINYFAAGSILEMKNRGILSGLSNGYFFPQNASTRAQFASAIQTILNNQ